MRLWRPFIYFTLLSVCFICVENNIKGYKKYLYKIIFSNLADSQKDTSILKWFSGKNHSKTNLTSKN